MVFYMVVVVSGRLDEGKHGGLVVVEMHICMAFYREEEVNGKLGGGVDSGGGLEVVEKGSSSGGLEVVENGSSMAS
jgi:hypothetical protein